MRDEFHESSPMQLPKINQIYTSREFILLKMQMLMHKFHEFFALNRSPFAMKHLLCLILSIIYLVNI